ncbi:hypothetical protein Cob_v006023 [Colletotrichum orbiculare MAFF 240422]|uniref:Uncharacterized protein n=1 Tax=Colletotrichum orbiculare (strain 104-T / ATCC 96160 / CBS 514.97 / LARS 414 / MAFF 240422) TaxID=1213857 RepID=A0A484FT88_COLOR|nr:hypothetical protein Cob_v006023 [Colletotrichum orbiculare MAFF 240422]
MPQNTVVLDGPVLADVIPRARNPPASRRGFYEGHGPSSIEVDDDELKLWMDSSGPSCQSQRHVYLYGLHYLPDICLSSSTSRVGDSLRAPSPSWPINSSAGFAVKSQGPWLGLGFVNVVYTHANGAELITCDPRRCYDHWPVWRGGTSQAKELRKSLLSDQQLIVYTKLFNKVRKETDHSESERGAVMRKLSYVEGHLLSIMAEQRSRVKLDKAPDHTIEDRVTPYA